MQAITITYSCFQLKIKCLGLVKDVDTPQRLMVTSWLFPENIVQLVLKNNFFPIKQEKK